jgi:hypothetical protein
MYRQYMRMMPVLATSIWSILNAHSGEETRSDTDTPSRSRRWGQ